MILWILNTAAARATNNIDAISRVVGKKPTINGFLISYADPSSRMNACQNPHVYQQIRKGRQ